MSTPKITWTPITGAEGMHGIRGMLANRSAECVRCYAGQWTVFAYENGRIVGAHRTGQKTCYVTPQQARMIARKWLLA